MFRKSDGTKGFSWMRMLDNSLPFMRMTDGYMDPGRLSIHYQDVVYSGQVTAGGIKYGLCDTALYTSAILASESESKKTYKKIQQKTGVIAADGTVDTTRVDANFTHQLATVPALRQKQIVDLLFWWEEEAQRLRKLSAEQAELHDLVMSAADPQQRQVYALLLERVHRKIHTKPSQRLDSVERDEDEMMVAFRNGTLGASMREQDERLPGYSPRS